MLDTVLGEAWLLLASLPINTHTHTHTHTHVCTHTRIYITPRGEGGAAVRPTQHTGLEWARGSQWSRPLPVTR
eukprot:NODE_4154_length_492_cov_38.164786_g3553_i0.p1 GENE.NODE_4154_length_492_cov_38.164786_g3553_i0~~NODE_4154_length_492_cov_38.164786_g3553_i0.p1  ORF type:complete len:73 (-),score=18.01 NODE_4154_length_492_cov_38.164786_g3553_i0:56-274(-)